MHPSVMIRAWVVVLVLTLAAATVVVVPLHPRAPTAAAAAAAAPTSYGITDLGTLGGQSSSAYAINDLGQVAGTAQTANGAMHAFRWEHGMMTDLGVPEGFADSVAFDLNDAGQIVGSATREADAITVGVAWNAGGMQVLEEAGAATGINEPGQVTTNAQDGALWQDGTYSPLRAPDGQPCCTQPEDLNDHGQVIGSSIQDGRLVAVRWEAGSVTALASLGGDSAAYGVNTHGQVVGWSDTARDPLEGFREHAVLWTDAAVHDLGTLGGDRSEAYAINDAGQVVGWSLTGADVTTVDYDHAFIYQDGVLTDLNTLLPAGSGWVVHGAWDVNTQGQIVGWGTYAGERRAFLMSPSEPSSGDGYQVCPLFDPATAFKGGSTVSITVRVCDTTGQNHSAPAIVLRAVSVEPGSLAGSAALNRNHVFQYRAHLDETGGYRYRLNTKGFDPGSYRLRVTIGDDPREHLIEFRLRY